MSSGFDNVSQLKIRITQGILVLLALCVSSLVAFAQGSRYWDGQRFTRLEPGMTIDVRTTEPIDEARTDYRVFNGIVDQDVLGTDGHLAIPRGSRVELIARREQDGELVLDLESVTVNGQRYAILTDSSQTVGTAGSNDLVGSILGAITNGAIRGQAVRIPRDTVMTFRLDRGLDIGVVDRGVTRDGYHYHDYYGRGRD